MTPDGQQTLDITLDDTWVYGPGILHGGFLMELLAARAVSDRHPHPLSTTTHFLRSPHVGPAQLQVTPLREGRSTSTTRVALVQDEQVHLDAVVTAGRLGQPRRPVYADLVPPELPPVDECLADTADGLGGKRNGIAENLDFRVDPATAGWITGSATSVAEVRGWLRSRTGRELDPLFLLCLADGLPPVTLTLGMSGWVPTVELTVHVRALPAPGWLRAVQRAHLIQDGWLDEECELWDSQGHLVAQARQLAGYRLAPDS